MNRVGRFVGKYRFLSNFYPVLLSYRGMVYESVEHAFQAAKTNNMKQKVWVQEAETPGEAKSRGRDVLIREDWEEFKVSVMLDLVRQKFKLHPELGEKLRATEGVELVEGNTWGDTFWGVCAMRGKNVLGKILMQVREELKYGW